MQPEKPISLANSKDISAYLAQNPFVLAPMVDHSDLPFRMLTRKYGAGLCFTPMIHARLYAEDPSYRTRIFRTMPEDRPLVVQIAGDDPNVLLTTAKLLEPHCDIIDINLGCPQGIAKRGNYGSFLLEQEELVLKIVKHLSSNLRVPLACNIRLFKDLNRSYAFVQRLEAEGCQMLTVHGRTRDQNKDMVGAANLEAIRKIKSLVSIPVIANGSVATFKDLGHILETTKCNGVMSAEAILEYPALFSDRNKEGVLDMDVLVADYLECTEKFPDQEHFVKSHLFKLLYMAFKEHTDLREKLTLSKTLAEYKEVASEVQKRRQGVALADKLGWYYRYHKVTMNGEPKTTAPPIPGSQAPQAPPVTTDQLTGQPKADNPGAPIEAPESLSDKRIKQQ
jgi:tRNA-dihydrouridine synthase 1